VSGSQTRTPERRRPRVKTHRVSKHGPSDLAPPTEGTHQQSESGSSSAPVCRQEIKHGDRIPSHCCLTCWSLAQRRGASAVLGISVLRSRYPQRVAARRTGPPDGHGLESLWRGSRGNGPKSVRRVRRSTLGFQGVAMPMQKSRKRISPQRSCSVRPLPVVKHPQQATKRSHSASRC
jgi:hypothetical protein